jgi:TolB-like protein/class 3 adenylate cyclase/Tfp pilus assembly protein PilF
MSAEGFKRKITAIMSSDVVGYSKLMGNDEAATVKTLEAYKSVMSALIDQHRGRVIDSPGDNMLSEFASVVDAVQCAVAIQKELISRNAELPEHRRMQFRIGINLGDVIQEEDRIYGDGVNIAARLEALADPGGICVSKTAFDHIETKLPLGYEFLGEQEVKNIAKPVGAYRVVMEPRVSVAGAVQEGKPVSLRQRKIIITGAVAVLTVAVVAGIWQFYMSRPSVEPVAVEKMAYPLPEKPSIAVLPFVNISGDPEQEYFSDGITENIITALSKIPKLFVIARDTTFTYKERAVKVQKVAQELGVRYVLEGSVQKSGEKVRITAQLIDAITGHHLWSERYDRNMKDIFALQDEITKKILTALEVNLGEGDQALMMAKGTRNLEAYLKVLQATYYRRLGNVEDNVKARRLSEEAIALDPNYAMAYSTLSRTHVMDVLLRSTESQQKSLETAVELARKALLLDDSLADAYDILGSTLVWQKNYEEGLAQLERALDLEPNGADISAHLGLAFWQYDKPQEAIQALKKAIRLNPNPPGWYLYVLAMVYNSIEKYDEAIVWGEKAVQLNPKDLIGHVMLCASYSSAGRMEDARREASEVLRINPKYSVSRSEKTSPQKNPVVKKRYYDSLRKAGLPD